jgi:antitoxin ParD1/3/4
MATMNISVPDPMKDWVQAQIDSGQYANASDYLRDLIRRDQAKRDRLVALQQAITEGLESGISPKSMQDVLQEARRRAGSQ